MRVFSVKVMQTYIIDDVTIIGLFNAADQTLIQESEKLGSRSRKLGQPTPKPWFTLLP